MAARQANEERKPSDRTESGNIMDVGPRRPISGLEWNVINPDV